jgi:hypothetical protein
MGIEHATNPDYAGLETGVVPGRSGWEDSPKPPLQMAGIADIGRAETTL